MYDPNGGRISVKNSFHLLIDAVGVTLTRSIIKTPVLPILLRNQILFDDIIKGNKNI